MLSLVKTRMCGISGVIHPGDSAPELWPSMREGDLVLWLRRARDMERAWRRARPGLAGHTIFSRGGEQPRTHATGGRPGLQSGEVSNSSGERRAEYERAGAPFRTQSDTEVVLEGFRLRGRNVCRELNGMFAFAVWDAGRQELVLARDEIGKKPLFWFEAGDSVWFASTLDAFADVRAWNGRLSDVSVALYSALGSIPADRTIYEQGRAVPPACTVAVSARSTPDVQRYWRLQFSRTARSRRSQLDEEYEELLTDAIRVRLRSDVPLALTFSGGVDSGTIAGLCAKRLDAPLACYTVDYHTEEDPSEETQNAERAARELGLDWRYVHYDYEQDLLAELDWLLPPV